MSAFSGDTQTFTPDSDVKGHLKLSAAFGSGLDPAPVSPTIGSGPWELLSGSILYTFSTNQRATSMKTDNYVVAPGLNLGMHYLRWIFRIKFSLYFRKYRYVFIKPTCTSFWNDVQIQDTIGIWQNIYSATDILGLQTETTVPIPSMRVRIRYIAYAF